ncbi:hypothetical protein EV714DRAFT_277464 [Schizophyllum commune]
MKLLLTIVLSIVATSALAAPSSPETDDPMNYQAWGREQKRERRDSGDTALEWWRWGKENKRAEAVEAREEDAITYPMWNKEDKRTDKGLWGGTNWALEEKRDTHDGLKRSDDGSLLLKPCGWGVEDKRRAGDCPPQLASDA